MPTRFGVGYSERTDSVTAGRDAAKEAIASLSGESPFELGLVFTTSRHEAKGFTQGLQEVLGESTPLVGGYANGVGVNDRSGYDGFQSGVAVMRSDNVAVRLFIEEGLPFNEREVGGRLGAQLAKAGVTPEQSMLLLMDAVNRKEERFQMNLAKPFLDEMRLALGAWPRCAGARMMGDMKFKPTWQWGGLELFQDAAVATVFDGNIRMDIASIYSCQPASAYHCVTKAKRGTVLEIDNRPALDVVSELLGDEIGANHNQAKFFVTMGLNKGAKWEPFEDSNYVNRMCVGVNPKNGGLVMAEADIVEGTEFQFMRRSFELDSIPERIQAFRSELEKEGRNPLLAFYINCAGRAAAYSGIDEEDVYYVQAACGEIPLLAIYEAGELALVKNDMQVFDWTGLFCLFSEKANDKK